MTGCYVELNTPATLVGYQALAGSGSAVQLAAMSNETLVSTSRTLAAVIATYFMVKKAIDGEVQCTQQLRGMQG